MASPSCNFFRQYLVVLLVAFCGDRGHAQDTSEQARFSANSENFGSSRTETICRALERAAVDNNLPVDFFARIIWQESKLVETARSSAGAQGIAQFMPRTASSRGLLDPFEPIAALREAASYLRELRKTFGNLGLAAAAYNAGPGRLSQWLSGKVRLPAETVAYVRLVTNRSVSEWKSVSSWEGADLPSGVPCTAHANVTDPSPQTESTRRKPLPSAPWGIQLSGAWAAGQVLAKYEFLRRKYFGALGDKDPLVVVTYGPSGRTQRYLVRVAESTRQEAELRCRKLQTLGGSCFVVRRPDLTASGRLPTRGLKI
jgi:hypothetical protein